MVLFFLLRVCCCCRRREIIRCCGCCFSGSNLVGIIHKGIVVCRSQSHLAFQESELFV